MQTKTIEFKSIAITLKMCSDCFKNLKPEDRGWPCEKEGNIHRERLLLFVRGASMHLACQCVFSKIEQKRSIKQKRKKVLEQCPAGTRWGSPCRQSSGHPSPVTGKGEC